MSTTLGCPICKRNPWLTVDGLAFHLERDHSHERVAAELAKRLATKAAPTPAVTEPEPTPEPPKPTPRRGEGQCHTGKIRYPSEAVARTELCGTVIARNRGRAKRRETRVYPCAACDGWHLTSMSTAPQNGATQ